VGLLSVLRRRPFLTPTECEQIDAGLATARRHAGAPIDLVIDQRTTAAPDIRAQQLFEGWHLSEPDRPRAVLVYACGATRQFAIVGGDEIRRTAPPAFWERLRRDLTRHFEEHRYCDGLFKAVAEIAIMQRSLFVATPACDGQPAPEGSDP
jgi:uncharacterized membrane protein